MNIVIVGAGETGRYIASILSKQQHNITLIDSNKKHLESASFQMDVATRYGSGADWQLLDDLLELSPHLFIALTPDDETNLVACSIAKHLGYPRTIARVHGNRYLNRSRLDFARIFSVDYFLSPELLVAHDIMKTIMSPNSLAIENFFHGSVQLRTIAIPKRWNKSHIPLKSLELPKDLMIGLIRRGNEPNEVIFPHGDDCILGKDEVTFIGEAVAVSKIHKFFGIEQRTIKSVVIVGGSLTAVHLAELLIQQKITVKIIEKDPAICSKLAEILPQSTIVNHDAADLSFLLGERIAQADLLIACTSSDEVNLLVAMLGKEAGCADSVVMLSNLSYIPLVTKLGMKHVVSSRISAANHILSQVFSGKVNSLISFYENQAEVVEINVSMDSKLVGIPLADLGPLFPKDFLIAMMQNRGRIMVAQGNRIICPGDTVIVISNPKHMQEMEKIF